MQTVYFGVVNYGALMVERGPVMLDGVQRDSITVHIPAEGADLGEVSRAMEEAVLAPEMRVSLDDTDGTVHEEIFRGYTQLVSIARHILPHFPGQAVISVQVAKQTQQEAEIAAIRAALAAAGIEVPGVAGNTADANTPEPDAAEGV